MNISKSFEVTTRCIKSGTIKYFEGYSTQNYTCEKLEIFPGKSIGKVKFMYNFHITN